MGRDRGNQTLLGGSFAVQPTGNRPIVVFAPSWWIRWPVHYFLAHQNGQLPRFHIIETGEVEISQAVDLSQIDVVISLNPLAIEQAFQQLEFPAKAIANPAKSCTYTSKNSDFQSNLQA